jgi:four helix bundle protein
MATIEKFQDIEAWKKARELTRKVYIRSKTGKFSKDYALRDQMRRASVSIMSNIAEGFGRGGTKEFIQFLSIAKGSATEVESQIYVALDQEYISDDAFKELQKLSRETQKLLGGLIKYLQKYDKRGHKYKKK